MESFMSYIVAIMAGVVSHIICKWLDDNDKR